MSNNKQELLDIYRNYWVYANYNDPYVNLDSDFKFNTENITQEIHRSIKYCPNFAFKYYREMLPYIEFDKDEELIDYLKRIVRREDFKDAGELKKLLENNKEIIRNGDKEVIYGPIQEMFSLSELKDINIEYFSEITLGHESDNIEPIKTLGYSINKKLILKHLDNKDVLKDFHKLLESIESQNKNKKLFEIEKCIVYNYDKKFQIFFVNPQKEELIEDFMQKLIDYFVSIKKNKIDSKQEEKSFEIFLESLHLNHEIKVKKDSNKKIKL